MLTTILIVIFVLGYTAIAFEHPLHINKTAPALLIGGLMWAVWALMDFNNIHFIEESLEVQLAETASILFFLMGAMTIVELIDAHKGFDIITNRITTNNPKILLWVVGGLAFFLSAILDNLTTSIVMVTLLRKLVYDRNTRLVFCGMVIIAANAGGAWSPIGDVTTTMLWIGKQISAPNIVKTLFLPSVVCAVVPLAVLSFSLKGTLDRPKVDKGLTDEDERVHGSLLILLLGIGALLFVPVFKTITHLPPYLGMLFGLSILWIVSEVLHKGKSHEEKKPYTAVYALSKIDVPSILFFLGILLAIGTLQGTGVLRIVAEYLDNTLGNKDVIAIVIGLLSAIVDNVPIVAATMKMYSLTDFPMDAKLWEFIAYAAGTGGSCLIIGSAAGVAVMGMEKIDFIWYLKKIAWLAFIGYIAGAFTYMAIYPIFAVH